MSGHSKFANIKHKKEKNDAAKGKVFTRIGQMIPLTAASRRQQEMQMLQTTSLSLTRDMAQAELRLL